MSRLRMRMKLTARGLGPEPLMAFISPLTPSPFNLHKPFNPIPFIVVPTVILLGAFALYSTWDLLLPLVQSRIIWGVFSIVLILTFTSGFMWNRIKNAPYIGVSQSGHVSWIAGGYQNQLGIESQVVAGTCEYRWLQLRRCSSSSKFASPQADHQMAFSHFQLSP